MIKVTKEFMVGVESIPLRIIAKDIKQAQKEILKKVLIVELEEVY